MRLQPISYFLCASILVYCFVSMIVLTAPSSFVLSIFVRSTLNASLYVMRIIAAAVMVSMVDHNATTLNTIAGSGVGIVLPLTSRARNHVGHKQLYYLSELYDNEFELYN